MDEEKVVETAVEKVQKVGILTKIKNVGSAIAQNPVVKKVAPIGAVVIGAIGGVILLGLGGKDDEDDDEVKAIDLEPYEESSDESEKTEE